MNVASPALSAAVCMRKPAGNGARMTSARLLLCRKQTREAEEASEFPGKITMEKYSTIFKKKCSQNT